MAHVHGDPDNQAENLDDLLGRGAGDPDIIGTYPGEDPKAANQNIYRISARTNQK